MICISDQGYYIGIRSWSSIPTLDIQQWVQNTILIPKERSQEEEVESVDGRFHEERDEKDEFRNFVKKF